MSLRSAHSAMRAWASYSAKLALTGPTSFDESE